MSFKSFKLMKRRPGLVAVSLFAFLAGTAVYYYGTWRQGRRALLWGVDEHLRAAAEVLPLLLPADFHDRAAAPDAISPPEEQDSRDMLNSLAQRFVLYSAQTAVMRDGNFYYTVPMVSGEDAQAQASWYFRPYEDIPGEFRRVYETGVPARLFHPGTEGGIRSYCARHMSPGGTPYLIVTEFDLTNIRAELDRTWMLPLVSVLWLFLISSPAACLLFLLSRDLTAANDSLRKANAALEEQLSQQLSRVADAEAVVRKERSELRWVREVHQNNLAGLIIFDQDGYVQDINTAAMDILGIDIRPAVGHKIADLSQQGDWDGLKKRIEQMGNMDSISAEIPYVRKDGSHMRLLLRVGKIRSYGAGVQIYYAYLMDVTELELNREQLSFMIHHDEASGLLNNVGLKTLLKDHLHEHDGRSPTVFVLAVHMKRTNAAFGVRVGDAALLEVARRLDEVVRRNEVLARLGGVDFAVATYDAVADNEDAEVARRMLSVLEEPITVAGHKFMLGGSVGLRTPQEDEAVEDVISKATIAAKEAKQRGRNSVLSFDALLRARSIRNIEIEDWLREEVSQEKKFQIYFQPIMKIATREICGVEALVRWPAPSGEWVSPDLFIPIAESSGLIEPLSEVLFDISARNFLEVKKFLPDIYLSLNISAVLFRKDLVTPLLRKYVEGNGLDPSQVILEITETALIDDMQRCHDTLVLLAGKGYSIAIDDFGMGNTSIAYLQKFPIHKLKIDKSFIQTIDQNRDDWNLVQAVLRMCEILRVDPIAEGVETEEQEQLLKEWRCPFGQGYLYHRPMDLETCLDLFRMKGNLKEGDLKGDQGGGA